jgi:hypothetical protein
MVRTVERLPSNWEALSSNPRTAKQIKTNTQKLWEERVGHQGVLSLNPSSASSELYVLG